MATYQILYWQEIPSLVEAKDEENTHKIQLSDKFQALIDEAAMRRGVAGTDAYLEEWNKGQKTDQDGKAEDVAKSIAEDIESRFTEIRDEALSKSE